MRENITLALQAQRGSCAASARRGSASSRRAGSRRSASARADLDRPAGTLSGGNQQKVLLARLLALAPRVLVLDEPTRGIDVGAKVEIQNLVGELADNGMSVMFISAELEEVLRVATASPCCATAAIVDDAAGRRTRPSTPCSPWWPSPMTTE